MTHGCERTAVRLLESLAARKGAKWLVSCENGELKGLFLAVFYAM